VKSDLETKRYVKSDPETKMCVKSDPEAKKYVKSHTKQYSKLKDSETLPQTYSRIRFNSSRPT
jgi:hypothetical protein